jgi:hypothetical protein
MLGISGKQFLFFMNSYEILHCFWKLNWYCFGLRIWNMSNISQWDLLRFLWECKCGLCSSALWHHVGGYQCFGMLVTTYKTVASQPRRLHSTMWANIPECEDDSLLGYCTVKSCWSRPRCILSLKHRSSSVRLHSAVSHKTVIFILILI